MPAPVTADDVLEYLQALRPAARRGLCAKLGEAPTESVPTLVRHCARLSMDPARIQVLLEALSDGVEAHLLRWAAEGSDARAWPSIDTGGVEYADWSKRSEELTAHGIARTDGMHVRILPVLVPALRALVPHRLLYVAHSMKEQPPWEFCLALAAACVSAHAPAVTRSGHVNEASMRKLEKRIGGPTLFHRPLPTLIHCLRAHGIAVARPGPSQAVLGIDRRAAEAFFARAPREAALATLWLTGKPEATSRVVAALEEASEGGQPTTLEALADLSSRARPTYGHVSSRDNLLDVGGRVNDLAAFRLVRVEDDLAQSIHFIRDPAPWGKAPFVVQPSFEVLVPWDAHPLVVLTLGLIADLEQIDRVCRFRLTRTSVERGRDHLGAASDLLAFLADHSATGLPDNVRATVLGWVGGARWMHAVDGDVVVVYDDEQKAFLRRQWPSAMELVPGVFVLPHGAASLLPGRARAAKVPLGRPVGPARSDEDEEVGRGSYPGPDRTVEALRAMTEAVAKHRAALKTPARSPKQKDAPAKAEAAARDARPVAATSQGEAQGPQAAGPPKLETAWKTLLPGALKDALEYAADAEQLVEVLYMNANGVRAERQLRVVDVRPVRQRWAVDAIDQHTRSLGIYWVDHIVAIRLVG